MTRVVLYEHPFAAVAPRIFEVENLSRWLLDHYGPRLTVRLQIYRGQPSGETEITNDIQSILASDASEYTVLQSPGVEMLATALINMAIAFAAGVVMQLLTPSPEMPANVNRTQQSPNNALGSRENQVRLMQRVEDIYGSVRSIPSLMMQTYTKYHDHLEYEYGYYCISRGYCAISEIKDGETLLSEIDGTSAAVYHPFTSPNSGSPFLTVGDPIIDGVVAVRRAIEVDGITLKAPNQVQPTHGMLHRFSGTGVGGRDRIVQVRPSPNFNTIAEPGDTLEVYTPTSTPQTTASALFQVVVSGSGQTISAPAGAGMFQYLVVGDTVSISGMTDPANNGNFAVAGVTATVLSLASGSGLVDETSEDAAFTVTRDYSGTYTIHSVGDGYVDLTASNWPVGEVEAYANLTLPGKSNETDWVTLPDRDRTEVWVNIVAPNGMYSDDGGSRGEMYVDVQIQIERLDDDTLAPTGQVESLTRRLSGAVSDQRAMTVEHVTAWTGPARVRASRTSEFNFSFEGLIVDETKWADLYAVTPVDKPHFGNKTTIHTVTRATLRATAVKTRQLNCIAGRMLPVYNGSSWSGAFDADGRLDSGTIHGTDRMVNVIAAVVQDPKIGAKPLADLDLAQVWSIQQQLDTWSDRAGKFNYTFDSDTLSFEETISIIANAAFCVPYRQTGRIRLALDAPRSAPTMLFTHRNKKPSSESITRRFASESEYDGVEFVYLDDISRQPETIVLPLDGSATKLKKFEIPGIADFEQAWFRANREYRKLRGQRLSIETDVTTDARMLLPYTRVANVDNTRFRSYDGEIVGQAGLALTLSRDVVFTPGEPHSIILMRRDGSLQSIACTAGAVANQVVLANAPSEAIVTEESADGIRTIFSFAADSARGAQAWSIQEIGASDGQYIKLTAVNYSAEYYAMDAEPVPARESIIY